MPPERYDIPTRPRMEKSHSCWPQTVWCVVDMFHKNGMRPLIIANGTKCYSISYCNSPWLYTRLKYTYSVLSVQIDSLPGNSKKWGIDLFVAFGVRLVHSWADATFRETTLHRQYTGQWHSICNKWHTHMQNMTHHMQYIEKWHSTCNKWHTRMQYMKKRHATCTI